MKVRITEVHPASYEYANRKKYIGMVFEVDGKITALTLNKGWYTLATKEIDKPVTCKYIEVPEYSIEYPGGTMNQDGTVTYKFKLDKPEVIFHGLPEPEKPKKKNVIQKIQDYDKLQRRYARILEGNKDLTLRCNKAESMLSEALHDRDFHATVADNWQAKLIEANKSHDEFKSKVMARMDEIESACEYLNNVMDEEEKTIGRRLKFSVGHNHVTIIVGNPVTACVLFNEVDGKYFDAHAICNPKDTYNWKKGAIQSLTNLFDAWFVPSEIDRTEWFGKLFNKYPELKAKQ